MYGKKKKERGKNVKNKTSEAGEVARYVSSSTGCDRTMRLDVEGCNYDITCLEERCKGES
jgi:hypothetical protein